MNLTSLFLRNFRNYEEAHFTFSPTLNYIYGENAQGKTNLLEAIHLLITGRSFRTQRLSDLIRFGAPAFYVEAQFKKNGIEQQLKVTFDGEGRTIVHNATSIPSLSALLGILNVVIISPEDHELVKGGPSARRQFIDLQIACESPLYLHHLSRYHRAMKHRNVLLRRRKIDTVSIWEEQMADSATHLTLKRLATIEQLGSEEALSTQSDQLTLSYQTSAPVKKNPDALKTYFLKQYEKQRPREIEQGSTLTGPHRDDLTILIGGHEARFFASEGQARSCVTSLRLAQWARLKKATEETPLLGIDDVGFSLDAEREKRLYSQLSTMGQVFITSPRKNPDLPDLTHLIHIRNGSLFL